MIFQYSLFNISNIQYFKNSILNDLSIFQYSIFNIQYFKYSIFSIQYFQGWRTSRPDLPPHPSRNDQRSHSRHCFCHQPARKVGYCVLILILILILMRLLISTVGALRLPTTYDNHPIPSIHVSLWRQPLHRRSNRINLINLIKTRQSKQREFCDYLFD